MPGAFIPAKQTPLLAKLTPLSGPGEFPMGPQCRVVCSSSLPVVDFPAVPTPGFDITGVLPQVAPPKPVIGSAPVPKSPDAVVRLAPRAAPVGPGVQPRAGAVGPAYAELPEAPVRSVPTVTPSDAGLPVGGFGETLLAPGLRTLEAPRFTLQEGQLVQVAGGTPWLLYGAYGAAGLAVLGLGYVLLSGGKKSAVANRRRRRGRSRRRR